MGGVKEFKRTCTRCGTEWYIPKDAAKERAPNKLEMLGAKMERAGTRASLISFTKSQKELKVQSLEGRPSACAETTRARTVVLRLSAKSRCGEVRSGQA
jgi:hypothetical protein